MPKTRNRARIEKEATQALEQIPTKTEATEPIEHTPTQTEAKKREETHSETSAEKSKVTDEEYTAQVARRVKRRQKEPVRISKYYYEKAVKKIRQYNPKKRGKHPMIKRHGFSGARALNCCHSYSLSSLNRSLVQPVVYTPTWNLLVKMIRNALLARNWSYCLRLYEAYLNHGSLRQQHFPYLVRLTFLLIFNMNVSNEHLDNFLTVTLAMRSAEERESFLWSLIELKDFLTLDTKTVSRDDESDEDTDDTTNVNDEIEDDPDMPLTDEETTFRDDDATPGITKSDSIQ